MRRLFSSRWLALALSVLVLASSGPAPSLAAMRAVAGGGGTPGGSSGQVQANINGAFAGMSGTSWDNTNKVLNITGTAAELATFYNGTDYLKLRAANLSLSAYKNALGASFVLSGDDGGHSTAGATLAFGAQGKITWQSTNRQDAGSVDTGLTRNAAGVVEVNSGTAGTFRDLRVRSVIQQPPATITPSSNGDLVIEATSNTTLTLKLKGTDGTVRSVALTLQ